MKSHEGMSTLNPTESEPQPIIKWSEIEGKLGEMTPVEGGNSDAQRGVITASDGSNLFIKIGVNEHTRGWAKKEINSYRFLEENDYPFAPRLLSTNTDRTGFAIDAILPADGWDWSDNWSKERLDATLIATDALAAIKPDARYTELLKPVITDDDNGWAKLMEFEERRIRLAEKLQGNLNSEVMVNMNEYVQRAAEYRVSHDTLVHDDVRADNCAWNKDRGEVKLVDWNWLELGDRKIDLAASLTHVQNSGFDVLQNYSDRLAPDALNWMAGFWLNSASQPIWEGGPEKLRDTQLQAGLTALRLARELS
jgi:fructosamine-3-kinase